MDIEPFGVEMWMNEWDTKCVWNLAETCVESLTIAELLQICGKNDDVLSPLLELNAPPTGVGGISVFGSTFERALNHHLGKNVDGHQQFRESSGGDWESLLSQSPPEDSL